MLTDGGSPVSDAKKLIRRGNQELACELLEPWLEAYPEDPAAWSAQAAALFGTGKLAEALIASRWSVRLRGSARDWCNYGMLLRKAGRMKEAETAQFEALAEDPKYAHARTELHKIHRDATAGDPVDDYPNKFY